MAEQTDATTGEIYLIALILNIKATAVPITATPSASNKLFGVSLKSITQTGCMIFMTTPAIVIPHPVTFRTSYVCSKRLGIIAHVPTAIAESRPKPNPNGVIVIVARLPCVVSKKIPSMATITNTTTFRFNF